MVTFDILRRRRVSRRTSLACTLASSQMRVLCLAEDRELLLQISVHRFAHVPSCLRDSQLLPASQKILHRGHNPHRRDLVTTGMVVIGW